MADEVYMDVDAVRQMAKSFGTIGDVLSTVNQTLETLSTILKTTAFIGAVGGGAIAFFIDMVKPHIKNMADKCGEFDRDLNSAATAYQNGDARGATRFY
jgi:hypothetical protein